MTAEQNQSGQFEEIVFKRTKIRKYKEGPLLNHVVDLQDDYASGHNLNIYVFKNGNVRLVLRTSDKATLIIAFNNDEKKSQNPIIAQVLKGMVESMADTDGRVPDIYVKESLRFKPGKSGVRLVNGMTVDANENGSMRVVNIKGDMSDSQILDLSVAESGDVGLSFRFPNLKKKQYDMTFCGPGGGGQSQIVSQGFRIIARELANTK